jgi:hypothetical protein
MTRRAWWRLRSEARRLERRRARRKTHEAVSAILRDLVERGIRPTMSADELH